MTIKNKFLLLFFSLPLVLAGCNMGLFDDDDNRDDTDYLLSGYYWMAGDETALTDEGAERASVNVYQLTNKDASPLSFSALVSAGTDGGRVNNYPERGQKSFYTVTLQESGVTPPSGYTGSDVYKVSVRTEFPRKEDIFDTYLENYYVLDAATADDWTSADPIVTKSSGSWQVDNKARETMQLNYQDDSARREWIVTDGTDDEFYAQFIEDALTTLPASSWTPTAYTGDTTNWWSSKVYYYQPVNNWVDFWYRDNKEVFGIRYYTETYNPSNDKYYRTALSFERFVHQDTLSTVTDDNYQSIIESIVFGNLPAGAENLAETVIWYEITENNKKTTKSFSVVNPTFGDSFNVDQIMEYNL